MHRNQRLSLSETPTSDIWGDVKSKGGGAVTSGSLFRVNAGSTVVIASVDAICKLGYSVKDVCDSKIVELYFTDSMEIYAFEQKVSSVYSEKFEISVDNVYCPFIRKGNTVSFLAKNKLQSGIDYLRYSRLIMDALEKDISLDFYPLEEFTRMKSKRYVSMKVDMEDLEFESGGVSRMNLFG
jgi:hypothetical protein